MNSSFPDGISLSEYQLTDGSKINLVVKREASSTSQTGTLNVLFHLPLQCNEIRWQSSMFFGFSSKTHLPLCQL
jgi:hypothetical protein